MRAFFRQVRLSARIGVDKVGAAWTGNQFTYICLQQGGLPRDARMRSHPGPTLFVTRAGPLAKTWLNCARKRILQPQPFSSNGQKILNRFPDISDIFVALARGINNNPLYESFKDNMNFSKKSRIILRGWRQKIKMNLQHTHTIQHTESERLSIFFSLVLC